LLYTAKSRVNHFDHLRAGKQACGKLTLETELLPLAKQRLRVYFGFSRLPFSKYAWAAQMYDSASQRELLHGLLMWLEVGGIAMANGPTGVGKSITIRRFVQSLDEARFQVFHFTYLPGTVIGFLRSLNRQLGLPMRQHAADLFDQAQTRLVSFQQERGPHPILLLDDAEGLRIPVLDALRRLTAYELDGEDRFSILLTGTEELVDQLQAPQLAPLRSRIVYAHSLRPFGLEDTRNYIRFHLQKAGVGSQLFSDEAVKRIFQISQGRPRSINQLALQAIIQAAAAGRDTVDGDFMASVIAAHPLYTNVQGATR